MRGALTAPRQPAGLNPSQTLRNFNALTRIA